MSTYEELETSVDSSEPVEFYTFSYQDQVRYYCTAPVPITRDTITYQPETISRGNTEITEDLNRVPLKVTTHKNLDPVLLFIRGVVHFPMSLTIFRGYAVPLVPDTFALIFKGLVTNCEFNDFEAELNCEPISSALRAPGLRKTYEPSCVHSLYSQHGCKVDKTAHAVASSVVSQQNGKILTLPQTYPDDFFAGGYVEIESALYMIASNTGNTITLSRFALFTGNPAITLYPGCQHTRQDCHNKFNNIANFGGFPWMPMKNPYTGDPIQWGG